MHRSRQLPSETIGKKQAMMTFALLLILAAIMGFGATLAIVWPLFM
jgi:4-hydroxybenzoate polyprenyltransferase